MPAKLHIVMQLVNNPSQVDVRISKNLIAYSLNNLME